MLCALESRGAGPRAAVDRHFRRHDRFGAGLRRGWPPCWASQRRAARWFSKPLQYAWMDEEVLLRLGSDGRARRPRPGRVGAAQGNLGRLSDRRLGRHLAAGAGQPLLRDGRGPPAPCHDRRSRAISLAEPHSAWPVRSAWPSGPRRSRRRAMPPSCSAVSRSSSRPA